MKQFVGFARICLKGLLFSKRNQSVIAEHTEGTIKLNLASEIGVSISCATLEAKRRIWAVWGQVLCSHRKTGKTREQVGKVKKKMKKEWGIEVNCEEEDKEEKQTNDKIKLGTYKNG